MNLSVYILVKDPNTIKPAVTYLKNRGWNIFVAKSLQVFIAQLTKEKPQYIILSSDYSHKKISSLPKILAQLFKVTSVALSESGSSLSVKTMYEMGLQNRIYPPLTGPSIERIFLKIAKEEEEKKNKKDDIVFRGENSKAGSDVINIQGSAKKSQEEDADLEQAKKALNQILYFDKEPDAAADGNGHIEGSAQSSADDSKLAGSSSHNADGSANTLNGMSEEDAQAARLKGKNLKDAHGNHLAEDGSISDEVENFFDANDPLKKPKGMWDKAGAKKKEKDLHGQDAVKKKKGPFAQGDDSSEDADEDDSDYGSAGAKKKRGPFAAGEEGSEDDDGFHHAQGGKRKRKGFADSESAEDDESDPLSASGAKKKSRSGFGQGHGDDDSADTHGQKSALNKKRGAAGGHSSDEGDSSEDPAQQGKDKKSRSGKSGQVTKDNDIGSVTAKGHKAGHNDQPPLDPKAAQAAKESTKKAAAEEAAKARAAAVHASFAGKLATMTGQKKEAATQAARAKEAQAKTKEALEAKANAEKETKEAKAREAAATANKANLAKENLVGSKKNYGQKVGPQGITKDGSDTAEDMVKRKVLLKEHEAHHDSLNDTSIISKATQDALEKTVVGGSLEDDQFRLKLTTNAACIVIESPKFSGYLVCAMGKDKKIDDKFIELVRERLFNFLISSGEDLSKEEKSLEVKIKQVAFQDWALEQAEFLRKSMHGGDEVAMAFFPRQDVKAPVEMHAEHTDMVMIHVDELKEDTVVEFDIYIHLPKNNKFVLYVPEGSRLFGTQKNRLSEKGVTHLHLKKENVNEVKKYRAQNFLNDKIDAFHENIEKAKKKAS